MILSEWHYIAYFPFRPHLAEQLLEVASEWRCKKLDNSDILFLKHDSSIFKQSSNPVCGLSMMEQVRLSAVWPIGELTGFALP